MFQIECALEPGTSQEQNKSASDVLKRYVDTEPTEQ